MASMAVPSAHAAHEPAYGLVDQAVAAELPNSFSVAQIVQNLQAPAATGQKSDSVTLAPADGVVTPSPQASDANANRSQKSPPRSPWIGALLELLTSQWGISALIGIAAGTFGIVLGLFSQRRQANRAIAPNAAKEDPTKTNGSSGGTVSDQSAIRLPPGPVTITDITIRNFKSIHELRVDLAGPSVLGGNWTCIAGINGAGKSSVLQAICLILLGERLLPQLGLERLRRMWRRADKDETPPEISAHCKIGSTTYELVLPFSEDGIDSETLRRRNDFASMSAVWRSLGDQVVVSYGATRNLSDYRDTRFASVSRQVQRQMTLFDPLTQVASVDALLHGGPAMQPALETLVTLLRRVLDEEDLGQIGTTAVSPLSFRRSGTTLEPLDLPDGFRSTVAWLADLCIAWQETSGSRSRDPANIAGIVLIDEIDLHLHASLQRGLIPRLRAALPKVQFIATTHSPLILSSFDRRELVILDSDAKDGIRRLDRQVFSMSMDEIYQWLMDTPPESQVIASMLEKADPKTEVMLAQSPTVSESDAEQLVARRHAFLRRIQSDADPPT